MEKCDQKMFKPAKILLSNEIKQMKQPNKAI